MSFNLTHVICRNQSLASRQYVYRIKEPASYGPSLQKAKSPGRVPRQAQPSGRMPLNQISRYRRYQITWRRTARRRRQDRRQRIGRGPCGSFSNLAIPQRVHLHPRRGFDNFRLEWHSVCVWDRPLVNRAPGALASMGCRPKILVRDGHRLWVSKRFDVKATNFAKRS